MTLYRIHMMIVKLSQPTMILINDNKKIFLALKYLIVQWETLGISRENRGIWNVFEYIAVKNGQIPSKFKGHKIPIPSLNSM